MKIKAIFKKIWEILKSNLWIKIIALFFAFLIWNYVITGTNPTRPKTVSDVSITFTNSAEFTAKGLVIDEIASEITDKVEVTVEAGVDSHKSITADTLKATVNLSEINTMGEATLKINASSMMNGVVVKTVKPSTITLQIDELAKREIPVSCKLTGESNDEYYIGEPKLSTNTVTIEGPRKRVENVAKGVCYLSKELLTTSMRSSCLLTLYDENDNEIALTEVDGSVPSVIVELDVLPKKTVLIDEQSVLDSITNVKQGYEITGVVIDPQTVEIAGKQELLDQIDSVKLKPLHAEEADVSVMLDGKLKEIDGVTFINGLDVQVLVRIAEIQSRRVFKNQSIECQNLKTGYTATITGDKEETVTVSGDKTVVDKMKDQDIQLYVDLSGLTEGVYVLQVMNEEVSGIAQEGFSFSLPEVTVTIKKR